MRLLPIDTFRSRVVRALRLLPAVMLLGAVHTSDAAAQARAERTPQTDRTVAVTKGSRLTVANDAGEVIIKTWDQSSLRVRASHGDRVNIEIQTNANIVSIRSRGTGPRTSVDYEITAPVWLPVRVSGQFIYIGIEGAQNEVSAETVRGDIVIRGGSGAVTAKSIQGEIVVEDAKGRITANSVNEGIRISGATGEVVAETTNGDITLTGGEARLVDLSTVNGDLRYEGAIPAGAQVRMTTHNGDITMALPETSSATFTVRTYNGEFVSNLATKPVGEVRRGRRTVYVLGSGGAEVELESFGGAIRLRRPGTAPQRRGRNPGQEHEAGIPRSDAHRDGSGTSLSGIEQPPR
jgi:DUF4097 and DUF4098 domain-containing protein YvlB